MITRQLTTTLGPAAILVAGSVFGAWLLSAPPAGALADTHQILTGGGGIGEGITHWTAPGLNASHGGNFPSAGLGESAAQMRLLAGVVSGLRVNVTTGNPPASGTFSLMVRINGADTALTCQVTGTGDCSALVNVPVTASARLAILVSNNFVASGGRMAYTYTLLYN